MLLTLGMRGVAGALMQTANPPACCQLLRGAGARLSTLPWPGGLVGWAATANSSGSSRAALEGPVSGGLERLASGAPDHERRGLPAGMRTSWGLAWSETSREASEGLPLPLRVAVPLRGARGLWGSWARSASSSSRSMLDESTARHAPSREARTAARTAAQSANSTKQPSGWRQST